MPKPVKAAASHLFSPLAFTGNSTFSDLARMKGSKGMKKALPHATRGRTVAWGIPFAVRKRIVVARDKPVGVKLAPVKAQWLVFMHTSDVPPQVKDSDGFIRATKGVGQLGAHAADYVFCYADGTEERVKMRERFQIGAVIPSFDACFEAVAEGSPHPIPPHYEQQTHWQWGLGETRALLGDGAPWMNWLWAWQNPRPRKTITGIRIEPVAGTVIISAISAGKASSVPLRWEPRRKALLRLPKGAELDSKLDGRGRLRQIQLDMGQIISARPRTVYPNDKWSRTRQNLPPEVVKNEIFIEYTAHPDACFHLSGGRRIPVAKAAGKTRSGPITPVKPARQRVTVKVVEKGSRKPTAVKLHVHGESGEYLAPMDRHRIINPSWFQDYTPEFLHPYGGTHSCAYIDGQSAMLLPLGRVYIEVTKGFEIKPVRKVVRVTGATREILIEIERVLPWRAKGWVTADTHVHFLSPPTAMLEGAAEGVNVVNLLASQWSELMTNVGDFDGKTVFGSSEAGGDGEYLVRVGTENRQHILGHISLLGYSGRIIVPMCSGGPSESALGDPVDVLLCQWAKQCRKQGGIVVVPHFPNPRAEHAVAIVNGDVDGIEMTAWADLYSGIDPYSLSDWYRYLNCGYFVPAVAGTDKMTTTTPVGGIRTYARVRKNRKFTYASWMDAVRSGNTFVTYGPLMEFAVEGKPAGTEIKVPATGGTVDVAWKLASVTVPMTRIDLVVNGEIRESKSVGPREDRGSWSLKVERSSWIAILVRAKYRDKPEMIAAHSSPVMVKVRGSEFLAAADGLTILEQIAGVLAFLDTVGTR
ncbi:MAG: CehA/McbA family metallohydrolase, partial [Planctomycetia bacterium]|nr:CehA/McbA family metallohydrolase [Planctomycetia bacterium]